jgi:tetratricopeptide (TPR) repeat protein
LNNIGWCLGLSGDYEQAARYCRRALDLQNELDDRFGLADTWDSLGHAEHRLGRHRQAADAYERSRRLWQELGPPLSGGGPADPDRRDAAGDR